MRWPASCGRLIGRLWPLLAVEDPVSPLGPLGLFEPNIFAAGPSTGYFDAGLAELVGLGWDRHRFHPDIGDARQRQSLQLILTRPFRSIVPDHP
jgi:hypothetical protein